MLNYLKKKNIKIGVLGGTFDPAHKGHLVISRIAKKKIKLKYIIWCITRKNPFKKQSKINVTKRIKIVKEMDENDLANVRNKEIGFIFQTFNLLPVYSIYENVLFPLILNGLKESHVRERVENMVAKVGLMDQINKKPAQLSGGQCQRVAIARALVKDPMLILADEPTANLDSENSHQILELMRELNHEYKAAVILSTHDEKVTRYIRREVRLEDGRVSWDKRRNGTEIET